MMIQPFEIHKEYLQCIVFQLMLIGLYVLDSKVIVMKNISLFFCMVMPNCFSKQHVGGFDYWSFPNSNIQHCE